MTNIRINNSTFSIEEEFEILSDKYQYQEHLGKGGNSSVECFIEKNSGIEYAVKIIPLDSCNDFYKREALRVKTELSILTKLKHNHIVRYYGHKLGKIKKRKFKGESSIVDALFIVMEKADCSLKDYIRNNKVDYSQYAGQMLGLCDALKLLHTLAIHRDLKPENILVVNSSWVISDFGLCSMLDGSGPEITSHSKAIGPKYWLSPEAFSRYIDIDEHRKEIICGSDIYQMCAIFWFVINRKHPSGILSLDDFTGPEKLYEPIHKGLQHDSSRRYNSTDDFLEAFKTIILEPESI